VSAPHQPASNVRSHPAEAYDPKTHRRHSS